MEEDTNQVEDGDESDIVHPDQVATVSVHLPLLKQHLVKRKMRANPDIVK
jgi:hypothetical protein